MADHIHVAADDARFLEREAGLQDGLALRLADGGWVRSVRSNWRATTSSGKRVKSRNSAWMASGSARASARARS